MVTRSEYRDRFGQAMAAAGKDAHAIARDLGVSYQAVAKVLAGTTKMLKADNNSAAAKALSVDTDWLATGNGDAARRADPNVSPKALEIARLYDQIEPSNRRIVEAMAHALQRPVITQPAAHRWSEPTRTQAQALKTPAESTPEQPSDKRAQ